MTTLREDIIDDLETVVTDWDDVTWNATTFKGIFHNEYEPVALFDGQIESRSPYVEVRDSDISGIAHDATVTINAVVYKVKEIKPSGFGMTILVLSKD